MSEYKFDHLVVLMLENRSFDHMLGRLYSPDNPLPYDKPPRGQSFDGVSPDIYNPVEPNFDPFDPARQVFVSRTVDYDTPKDNSVGHAFRDVQIQIHGLPGQVGTMSGFVNDRVLQWPGIPLLLCFRRSTLAWIGSAR
jgi:phospholipase C